MATFEDETEPETPSAEASIYIMKTAIGREQTASERLADRVRRSGAPVWSILMPLTITMPRACVQRIDEGKEEVTVELFEAMVPIPITVRGDHVRVIEKEPN